MKFNWRYPSNHVRIQQNEVTVTNPAAAMGGRLRAALLCMTQHDLSAWNSVLCISFTNNFLKIPQCQGFKT